MLPRRWDSLSFRPARIESSIERAMPLSANTFRCETSDVFPLWSAYCITDDKGAPFIVACCDDDVASGDGTMPEVSIANGDS